MSFARYVDIISTLNTVSVPESVGPTGKQVMVEYYLAAAIASKLDVGTSKEEQDLLSKLAGTFVSIVNEYYPLNLSTTMQQVFNFYNTRCDIVYQDSSFTRFALGVDLIIRDDRYLGLADTPLHPPLLATVQSIVRTLAEDIGAPVDGNDNTEE